MALRLGEETFSNDITIRVRARPDESNDWPQRVAAAANAVMMRADRQWPVTGALSLELTFFLPSRGRAHPMLPDISRLTEATIAGLQAAGVWDGAAYIAACSAVKENMLGWAAGAAIHIRELEPREAWKRRSEMRSRPRFHSLPLIASS